MVVGNRGGKEQIVAALLYIFPVGIAVTVSESDREKKKKKKRRKKKVKRKKDGSFVSIVSRVSFNACALLSFPDV